LLLGDSTLSSVYFFTVPIHLWATANSLLCTCKPWRVLTFGFFVIDGINETAHVYTRSFFLPFFSGFDEFRCALVGWLVQRYSLPVGLGFTLSMSVWISDTWNRYELMKLRSCFPKLFIAAWTALLYSRTVQEFEVERLLTIRPPLIWWPRGKHGGVWYGPGIPLFHSPLSQGCAQSPPLDPPLGRLGQRVSSVKL
jgi:hypothetical protein